MFVPMILGLVLIESLVIYALIAFVLWKTLRRLEISQILTDWLREFFAAEV